MEIPRYEELKVQKARIDQLLRNVLDRDVGLCDDPDRVRYVLGDLAMNSGGNDGGFTGPWWPLITIVR